MKRVLTLGAALAAGILGTHTATQAETLRLGSAIPAGQTVEFNVYLPLRNKAGLEALIAAQQNPNSHLYHHWITPAKFATSFGPSTATMQKVAQSFALRGLSVEVHARSLHITGNAATVGYALGTNLVDGVTTKGEHHLVGAKPLSLPQAAIDAGGHVFSFQRSIHVAHVDSHVVPGVKFSADAPLNRLSTTGGYYFDDLKQAYKYPSYKTMVTVDGVTKRLDGTGTTIAILMSSNVYDSDIAAMFNNENFSKFAGVADPVLYQRVRVRGGATLNSDALDEASLDTQQALGGAPGAHVILYEIPNLSDSNILAGYTAIVDANVADVVSSSFGGCELLYTAAYDGNSSALTAEHEEYLQGNAEGISFLASSGDESGLGCPTPAYFNGGAGSFIAAVESPADDPNVTAVGGTNLVTGYKPPTLASNYSSENAWSDPENPYDPYGLGQNVSGGLWGASGGLSTIFSQPSYQTLIKTGTKTARAVPDIGMQVGGCPIGIAITPCNGGDSAIDGSGNTDRSYVYTVVNGSTVGVIGTSVSSPEFASAVALLVEVQGRQGNLNNYIYAAAAAQHAAGNNNALATNMFHTGIKGYNGVVANGSIDGYYNYTTGVGTPEVYRFVGEPSAAVAGNPRTASNP